jgi:hypothetical protein
MYFSVPGGSKKVRDFSILAPSFRPLTSYFIFCLTDSAALAKPLGPETQARIVSPDEPITGDVWGVGGKSAPLRRASSMTAKTNAKERSRSKSRARAEAEGIVLADEDSDVNVVLTEEPGKMEVKEEEKETEHVESFTTGPRSVPTHWKQTVFLLREGVSVVEGMLFIRWHVLHFLLYATCYAPHGATSCYILFSLYLCLYLFLF